MRIVVADEISPIMQAVGHQVEREARQGPLRRDLAACSKPYTEVPKRLGIMERGRAPAAARVRCSQELAHDPASVSGSPTDPAPLQNGFAARRSP